MKLNPGIIPALITPFDAGAEVNHQALGKLVDNLIRRGAQGFYACGSTAEAFLLNLDERKQILETVLSAAAGRVPVICHIGSVSTDQAIDLGRHARQAGAAAVSAVPPFYYKFSLEELRLHYLDIIEAVGLPFIPYNFPALSGVTITVDNFSAVLTHPLVIGIKHTSHDFYQLERMKKAVPTLIVFNGYDEMFLAGLAMGADGAIGSTFNFMPERFLEMRRLFGLGKLQEARCLQIEANEIIGTVIEHGSLNAHKFLISLQGIECGQCRRPFRPLTEEARVRLRSVFERYLA